MSIRSLVLMENSPSTAVTAYSDPVRVDQRTTALRHHHTVAITTSNFRGRVSIEATLMPEPQDGDWFTIPLGGQPYVDCITSTTKTFGFTFVGRFMWMRCKVDRQHLMPTFIDLDIAAAHGMIDHVLLK